MSPAVSVHAFFQHMPPYSAATALRGASIMVALAHCLEGRPHDIRIFTSIPKPDALPGLTVESIGAPEVENALGLPSRILGELRMGWVAGKAMFDGDTRCGLAVISTPGYLAALVIASAARRRGVPYVLELRDVFPQVYAEAGLLQRGSWLYRFFERRTHAMYTGALAVIAATRGLARTVTEDTPQARVHLVYNGFPSRLLARRATKHERFTVCFHGVMGFFQDIETLVEVARALVPHHVDMVVVGFGRKETLIAEACLPNLQFLGRQPFDATVEQVERCHLGLCLRKDDEVSRDAFPVKVWECLGLGLPSIVTPACEAGEFLEAESCGFQLPSGDVRRIVEHVLRLKDNPDELSALTERCRRVAERFTREQTGLEAARVVEQCLQSALEMPGPGAELKMPKAQRSSQREGQHR